MATQEKGWHRGDWVIRGTESGFVKADMSNEDEHLVVHWQSGVEKTHHSRLGEIRRATRAEAVEAAKLGAISSLRALETIESLEKVEAMMAERSRTIGSKREQQTVDDLIRRGFAQPFECGWDRRNADLIVLLALQPDEVGWLFKLREWLHRPIHARYHRPR